MGNKYGGLIIVLMATSVTAIWDRLIQEQKAMRPTTMALQDYTRIPIAEYVPSLCSQCYCPTDKISNPYRINCRSQLMEVMPPFWESFMRPGTTNVDNVHLDLTNNHIRFVGELAPSYVLDALILDVNEIDLIASYAFANLIHLKYLSLKSNLIEKLAKDAFWTRTGVSSPIEILDLRSNKLAHLDDDIFQNLDRLVVLRLGGNPFGVLDGSTVIALNGLRMLSTLDLSSTAITDLPYSLINPVRRLEELDLSSNSLKKVPEVIQMAGRLLRLVLDNNPMDELDAASFIGLVTLEKLNVSFMQTLKIIYPGTFQLLPRLQILNCAHNPHLELIEKFAFTDHLGQGPTSMQRVNLRHNNLTTLSHELFEGIQVQSLDIQENPLRCSCRLVWLQKRHLTDDLAAELRCVEPVSLSGRLLKEVEIDEPECPEKEEQELHIASFTRLKDTIYKSNVLLAVVLSLGSVLLVGIAIFIAKSSPRLRYTVMKSHGPFAADYNNSSYDNEAYDVYTVTSKQ